MQSKRPPGERTPPAFIMSTLLFGGRKTTGRRLSPKSTIASPTPTSAVSSAPVLSRSRNNNALSTTSSVTHTAADVLGRVQLSLEELRTKFRELDEYNKNLREEVREIKARAQQEAATRMELEQMLKNVTQDLDQTRHDLEQEARVRSEMVEIQARARALLTPTTQRRK